MIDAWWARTRADGVSRATVSDVPATTPRSIGSCPRSWHSGTLLSSHNGTSEQRLGAGVGRHHPPSWAPRVPSEPARRPRDSLIPVRRPVPAQPILVVRLGGLTPAEAPFFLALLGQHRLVVWIGSHDPMIAHRKLVAPPSSTSGCALT